MNQRLAIAWRDPKFVLGCNHLSQIIKASYCVQTVEHLRQWIDKATLENDFTTHIIWEQLSIGYISYFATGVGQ